VDNVTHSLIGATMGEGIRSLRVFRDRSPRFLSAILWAAILGSNFPDSDIVLNPFLNGGKLGYLLHHRGYTHTLITTPLQALATLMLAALIAGFRRPKDLPRKDWLILFSISLLSVLFHISADFLNDYGVHPFAPFWSHWVYGGVLFIVEPLLLASMLPLLVFGFSSRRARGIGIAGCAGLLGLLWLTQIVTWPVAMASTLVLALGLWTQKKRPGVAQPIGLSALVLAVFWVLGHQTASMVRDQVILEHPEEQITQLVTTPSPGNPFCWRVISVSRLDMEAMSGQFSGKPMTPFFERLGTVSLWPSLFSPEQCAFRSEHEQTAPLMKASLVSGPSIHWVGEFRGTVENLGVEAEQYCRFRQYLRWARVPFFFKTQENSLLAGDLRYDHEKGLGFAELEVAPGEPCLAHEPSWDSPSGLLPAGLQEKR
jgi:inner membrane protein